MIIGYQLNNELIEATGIKRGMTVLIPKGTKVVSSHPSKGIYLTKKDIKVKVRSIGCGRNVPVNDDFYRDQIVEYSNQKGSYCILGKATDGNLLPRGLNSSIPLNNPEVIWAGTGGYWCRVDINKVTLIK